MIRRLGTCYKRLTLIGVVLHLNNMAAEPLQLRLDGIGGDIKKDIRLKANLPQTGRGTESNVI